MPGPFQGALYSQINQGGYSGNYDNTVPASVPEPDNSVGGAASVAGSQQGPIDPWDVKPGRNNPAGPVAEQETLRAEEAQRTADRAKQFGQANQQVDLDTKIAQLRLAEQQLANAQDPNVRAAASLAVDLARVNVAKAQFELQQAQDPNNTPQAIAEFQSELRIKEQQLKDKAARVLQDDQIKAAWDQIVFQQDELGNRQTQQINSTEKISENQINATKENIKLQAGVSVRGQDLDRQSAIDKFNVDMTANKIKAGELSVDRAYKTLELDISQRRLPSEIARNIGEAIAPMIPHLSAYKEGGIPNGFEAGGPFEMAMRQGGAQSYDPNAYAVHPVKMDIMGMAKNAGAQVINRPMQDPNTAIPNPQIDTSGQATPIPANLQMPDNLVGDLKNQLAASLAQTNQLNQR